MPGTAVYVSAFCVSQPGAFLLFPTAVSAAPAAAVATAAAAAAAATACCDVLMLNCSWCDVLVTFFSIRLGCDGYRTE